MTSVSTTDDFDVWFTSLGYDAKVEVIAKVELLKTFGHQLSRPHADTLKGSKHANMKELRGRTATQVLRVAFALDPSRNAILLVGGNKSGVNEKRFYKALINRADLLYDAHLRKLRADGKDRH